MAQSAIIFTINRVIRRLTTDASPTIGSDETQVVLAAPIDLSGANPGWKLDTSTPPLKVACTLAEWQAAGEDRAFNQQQAQTRVNNVLNGLTTMATDCTTVANDATLPADVRKMGQDLTAFANFFKNFLQNQ